MPVRLLAATNNPHKLTEFRRILGPLGVDVVTPADLGISLEVEENGATFAENAGIKARAFHEAGGLPALADDSGLVVDALGGEPGIYSARYGGPGLNDADRTALVLRRMEGIAGEQRTARFIAAIVLVAPGKEPLLFEGTVEGTIADRARGDNGFGHDPIFYYPPFGCTFGEAAPEAKDSVSHRARALAALGHYLRQSEYPGILGRTHEESSSG